MKAIIYTRSATNEQSQLKCQKGLLEKYCKNNKIKMIKHFEETTGKNFSYPEFDKLLEFVTKNKVDKIIVKSWDRLGRDFNKVNAIKNKLTGMDIEIMSIDNSDLNFINFLNFKI